MCHIHLVIYVLGEVEIGMKSMHFLFKKRNTLGK